MTPGRPKFLRQLLSFLPRNFIDSGGKIDQKDWEKSVEREKLKFERGRCFDFFFGRVFDLRLKSLILERKHRRFGFAGVLFPLKEFNKQDVVKTWR